MSSSLGTCGKHGLVPCTVYCECMWMVVTLGQVCRKACNLRHRAAEQCQLSSELLSFAQLCLLSFFLSLSKCITVTTCARSRAMTWGLFVCCSAPLPLLCWIRKSKLTRPGVLCSFRNNSHSIKWCFNLHDYLWSSFIGILHFHA